ncbi:DNA polymerase III subunit [Mesoplasma tabanidae]|uniref:DNA polymerase III subunit delta n=1 Tax=Mesoplasma tabanidae TaxID=219745 RepID=A0A2K8P591_9MOLU|nr:DNA polymerase III subunit [Mesoplasma tabanidae]ATZ21919.1 DNA polymerase III subunit delta' [Mesoplasma tabanidae]
MKKRETLEKFIEQLKTKKMFSSILVSNDNQDNLNEFANEFARIIFCENLSIENDQCVNCKRFENKSLANLVFLGDGSLAINKSDVIELMHKFSLTTNEVNKFKVYILANAENLKNESGNALLKFIEEPPENTIAILLTKNKSQVLPTIKSRCKLIVLENKNRNDNSQNLIEEILGKDKNTILLSNSELKKMDKSELIGILEEAYSRTIIKKYLNIAEATLQLINDLKFTFQTNLAIDVFLIHVSEVI